MNAVRRTLGEARRVAVAAGVDHATRAVVRRVHVELARSLRILEGRVVRFQLDDEVGAAIGDAARYIKAAMRSLKLAAYG